MPTTCNTVEIAWDTNWKKAGEDQLSMNLHLLNETSLVLEIVDALNLSSKEYQNLIVNTEYKSKMIINRYGITQEYLIESPTDAYDSAPPTITFNRDSKSSGTWKNGLELTVNWSPICSSTNYRVELNGVEIYNGINTSVIIDWNYDTSINDVTVFSSVDTNQEHINQAINLYDGTTGFDIISGPFPQPLAQYDGDIWFKFTSTSGQCYYKIGNGSPVSFNNNFTFTFNKYNLITGSDTYISIWSDNPLTDLSIINRKTSNFKFNKLTNPIDMSNLFNNQTFFKNTTLNEFRINEISSQVPIIGCAGMFENSFSNSAGLINGVDLFNTENVTDFSEMFYKTEITSIPNFNTSLGTNFNRFATGTSITSIPLFNMNNVTNMNYSFSECSLLTEIPEFDFNGNTVTFDSSFKNCTSLININFINFIMDDASYICENNTSLTNFPQPISTVSSSLVSSWEKCSSIEVFPDLNLHLLDTKNFNSTFEDCSSLLSLPNMKYPGSTSNIKMFKNCSSLENIGELNTSNSISTIEMFYGCSMLDCITSVNTNLSSSSGATPGLNNRDMFFNANVLQNPTLSEQSFISGSAGLNYTNVNPCPIGNPISITNFTATDNEKEKITFNWTIQSDSYSYDLYEDNFLIKSNILPGNSILKKEDNTIYAYKVKQNNINGSTFSNSNNGNAIANEIHIRFVVLRDVNMELIGDSVEVYSDIGVSSIKTGTFLLTPGDYRVNFGSSLTGYSFDNDTFAIGAMTIEDVSQLTSGVRMAIGAHPLIISDVTKLENITNFEGAFDASDLSSITLFDTSNVTNFSSMFRRTNITTIPLFDTSSALDLSYFIANTNITTIPLFVTNSCTNFEGIFSNMLNITTIPAIIVSSGTNFRGFIQRSSNITSLPFLDTSNGTNFDSFFAEMRHLASLPLIDTSSGTNFRFMCYRINSQIGSISSTIVPQFDTSSGTSFNSMFRSANSLELPSTFDTSSGTSFSSMFEGFWGQSIPSLDTSSGTSFGSMFQNCRNLRCIPKINTLNQELIQPGILDLPGTYDMFKGTKSILINPNTAEKSLILSGFNYINANPCPNLGPIPVLDFYNTVSGNDITFTWTDSPDTDTYNLIKNGSLINSNISSPYVYNTSIGGQFMYELQQINANGTSYSNVNYANVGTSIPAVSLTLRTGSQANGNRECIAEWSVASAETTSLSYRWIWNSGDDIVTGNLSRDEVQTTYLGPQANVNNVYFELTQIGPGGSNVTTAGPIYT